MGIDDESRHPELCSEAAGGVTRNIVSLFREPDAGNPPVRFDEREQETELGQTGLRRVARKRPQQPPGDLSHCACSRLYSPSHSKSRGFDLSEKIEGVTSSAEDSEAGML